MDLLWTSRDESANEGGRLSNPGGRSERVDRAGCLGHEQGEVVPPRRQLRPRGNTDARVLELQLQEIFGVVAGGNLVASTFTRAADDATAMSTGTTPASAADGEVEGFGAARARVSRRGFDFRFRCALCAMVDDRHL